MLNHILTRSHGKKYAVIENEYGSVCVPPGRRAAPAPRSSRAAPAQVGVDDALVKQKFDTDEEIFEMNNGCIWYVPGTGVTTRGCLTTLAAAAP